MDSCKITVMFTVTTDDLGHKLTLDFEAKVTDTKGYV